MKLISKINSDSKNDKSIMNKKKDVQEIKKDGQDTNKEIPKKNTKNDENDYKDILWLTAC